MNYMPTDACLRAATEAAAGKLTKEEIDKIFQKVSEESEKIRNSPDRTDMADRLARMAEEEANKAQIRAALNKRITALNILTFDRLDAATQKMIEGGMKPHKVLQSLMRGTEHYVEGSRDSVFARATSFEQLFINDAFRQMQRENPKVLHMLMDKEFNNSVTREMMEIKPGGNPGVTKSPEAKYVSKVLSTYYELSRQRLNKLGASIGKLDGWAGSQSHDDQKLIAAGKKQWVSDIYDQLDKARSFPDYQSESEAKDILEDIYDTIVMGKSKYDDKMPSGRVNPANLAKAQGKSRVLHFKDADAALAYQEKYGYGNAITSFIAHQQKAAKISAAMEMFGPNPENMINKLAQRMQEDIRNNTTMDYKAKQKALAKLNTEAGGLKTSIDVMSGLISRPVDSNLATIGNNIRAGQAVAKLGGAIFSSLAPDTFTHAIAGQFRGSGFFNTFAKTIHGLFEGRSSAEQKELSYLLGEGADALIGEINHAFVANDLPSGMVANATNTFFKWTGMHWWDQKQRGTAVRVISAELAMRAESEFKNLPAAYQHVLKQAGINELHWNIIRQSALTTLENGNKYMTGDVVRGLSDDQIHPFVADRLTKADADLVDRQTKRAEKTAREGEWVQKRVFREAARAGREEARLEAMLKNRKDLTDTAIASMQEQIKDYRAYQDELSEAFDQGSGSSEATLAVREDRYKRRIAGLQNEGRDLLSSHLDTIKGIDDKLQSDINRHVEKMNNLEDQVAQGKANTADASARFKELSDGLNDLIGRVDDKKADLSEDAQNRLDALSEKLDELSGSLAETQAAYPVSKSQARRLGEAQGVTKKQIQALEKRAKDISNRTDKYAKGKIADVLAGQTKREAQIKEFSDRMQRYADARAEAARDDNSEHSQRIKDIYDDGRHELEMKLRGFISDQSKYAMLSPDDRVREITTLGLRPGTIAGEAVRFLMQFKAFTIAHTQRVIGRAIFGQRRDASMFERSAHIGTILSALLAAGYISSTMKQLAKGQWPPKNPADPAVILESLQMGGGLGVMGDYLIGQSSGFGSGPIETLAGPTAGTAADILKLWYKTAGWSYNKLSGAPTSSSPAGDAIRLVQGHTPFANAFYLKPVIDMLFMNAVKDWANPGTTQRAAQRLAKEGQHNLFPQKLF